MLIRIRILPYSILNNLAKKLNKAEGGSYKLSLLPIVPPLIFTCELVVVPPKLFPPKMLVAFPLVVVI